MIALLVSFASCSIYLHNEEKSFLSWMRSTNQFFTGDEYYLRLGIYLTNSRLVKEHNAANKSFRVELNKFAAYTPAEYKSLLGLRIKVNKQNAIKSVKKNDLDSLDWREKGVVNSIRDQHLCGSCWAFSVLQASESAYAIKTGTLQKYSEQELVDCTSFCQGCGGGDMAAAFNFIISFHDGHFVLESDYPYTGFDGDCLYDDVPHVGSLSSYVAIVEGDEDDLEAKVQIGPVSIGIDSSTWSFSLYKEGIFDDSTCSSTQLDHGVGLVGYGIENETKYWIVRNSWGESWGEDGYIRMIRKNNQCGIASAANLPYA